MLAKTSPSSCWINFPSSLACQLLSETDPKTTKDVLDYAYIHKAKQLPVMPGFSTQMLQNRAAMGQRVLTLIIVGDERGFEG